MNKSKERDKIAVKSGITGIVLNLLLCGTKFFAGITSSSVAIIADSLNNLSDSASNLVTIIGTWLSSKPKDKEHPFGHGRFEYISALIVAFIILLMGFELGKSSIIKILHPEQVKFSLLNLILLVFAVLVKFGMGILNHLLYKKTGNINLKAVRQDSFNDCLATLATIAALLISSFTKFHHADGIIGLAVCIFVIASGIEILRDVLNPLLGQPPSKEMVQNVENIILKQKMISGVHDLIIHNYGPDNMIASAHAEVPDSVEINKIHDAIDKAEKEVREKLNINICLHMDPVSFNDEAFKKYKKLTEEIISEYNPEFSFHDFRVSQKRHTTLIFDLVVPFNYKEENSKIYSDLREQFALKGENVELRILIENSFV